MEDRARNPDPTGEATARSGSRATLDEIQAAIRPITSWDDSDIVGLTDEEPRSLTQDPLN